MNEHCFTTSYNNFISDHKAIVVRIGSTESKLKAKIKEKQLFDQESHLKSRQDTQEENFEGTYSSKRKKQKTPEKRTIFTRRFRNPDMATCWLNSCLQLILTAMDYDEFSQLAFNSELGEELLALETNSRTGALDPTNVKDIVVTAEDMRVAKRLSELSYQVINKDEVEEKAHLIRNLHLDLSRGQQCVTDFFICLGENLVNWPDVYTQFSFNLIHSTVCSCNHRNSYETNQIYVEMPVPPNGSDLRNYVEEFFNGGSSILRDCRDGCNTLSQKIQRTELHNSEEAKFLIVILSRGIETVDGYQLVDNKINSTDKVTIRYRIMKV